MNKEKWTSNKGDREDHYFLDETRKHYVFGYNPKYVSKEKVKQIEKIIYGKGKN